MIIDLLGTPHFHAVCLVLTSTGAIEALIAIWAATSRGHWFWRALAVWAGIVVLLPIRAYQPALVFAISSPLTIVLIGFIQSRRGKTERRKLDYLRFGLRDLLLATAFVGLALATLLQLLPRLEELHFKEFGLVLAAQTLIPTLAWGLLTTKQRRLCGLALVLGVIALGAAPRYVRGVVNYDWRLVGCLFEGGGYRYRDVRAAAIAGGELALLMLFLIPMVHAGMYRLRAFRFLLVASWAVCLCLIYWQMLGRLPMPPVFRGGTNHYHRLIEIIARMRALEKAGLSKASDLERQALITETIDLVQAANFVPYEPETDSAFDTWNDKFIARIQYTRSLARAIDGDCGKALADGQTEVARKLALTNVRLGLMLQRGSSLVESLIGTAIQNMGNQRLAAMRGELSSDQGRRTIAEWDKALSEHEDVKSIHYRDSAMAENAYGWAARLGNILDRDWRIQGDWSYDDVQNRLRTTVQLLQTDLAVRIYRDEHGQLPQRLDQLVPAILPGVPLDAYSKQPLIYRPAGDQWVLYSIGHDGVDDGGKFTNMQRYNERDFLGRFVRGYDYDLETINRP